MGLFFVGSAVLCTAVEGSMTKERDRVGFRSVRFHQRDKIQSLGMSCNRKTERSVKGTACVCVWCLTLRCQTKHIAKHVRMVHSHSAHQLCDGPQSFDGTKRSVRAWPGVSPVLVQWVSEHSKKKQQFSKRVIAVPPRQLS